MGEPIEVARACSSGSAYERIAAWARDAGEVLLHPYMSIDPVWELAARLARDAQASVRVIGPPPPVTWIANDKKRFTELVASVLGREWIGPTLFAGSAEAIARNLSRLASDHQRVGLKRSCCRLVKILERPAVQQFAPFQRPLESAIVVGYVFQFSGRSRDGLEDHAELHLRVRG